MGTVVRVVPEEIIELRGFFMQAQPVVHLGHGELVFVGEKDAFGQLLLSGVHVGYLPIRRLLFGD
jgi:hypothetical protein